MVNKKNVIKIPLFYGLILFIWYVLSWAMPCPGGLMCSDLVGRILGVMIFTFLPVVTMLPFSLITYKMPDNVFSAWWLFAWPWVLAMCAVMFVFTLGGSGSRLSGAYSASLLGLIMLILGSVYFVGSTVKILHARKK